MISLGCLPDDRISSLDLSMQRYDGGIGGYDHSEKFKT
jgi:hypothetical protein